MNTLNTMTSSNKLLLAAGAAVTTVTLTILFTPSPVKRKFVPPPPNETYEEEDKNARLRLTESRLKKATPDDGFDAIIIGAGPSGMCAAASLARLGYRCCVLEQGEELGGGAHVFSLKGYEFETGVHYLGTDVEMEKMLSFATCGMIDIADIGTPVEGEGLMHDEIIIGPWDKNDTERRYPFTKGKDGEKEGESFRRMLLSKFPDEKSKVERFVDEVMKCRSYKYKQSAAWLFRLKALSWLPAGLRLALTKVLARDFWNHTQITAEDWLRSIDIDPSGELGSVCLGQYSDAGVRPDELSTALYLGVIAHYINGARYPIGGSGAIPRKMNAVIRAAGGVSFTQAYVNALVVENKKVQGVVVNKNNVSIRAPIVINSAGALPSYELLSEHVNVDKQISSLKSTDKPSVAFIFLFVSLDITKQPEKERDETSHNRWIYPKGEFTAYEKELDDSEPWVLPQRLFVASGSSKDGGWQTRHGKNKKTIVVLAACPWSWVSEWKDLDKKGRDASKGYQSFKEATKKCLWEQGFMRVYPHLEKYVVDKEVGTPLTTNNFLAKVHGECYGRSAMPMHWGCPELVPKTPLSGYWLTGQDTGTLGLAGSLASGYLTANVVSGCARLGNVIRALELSSAIQGEEAIYG